MSLFHLIKRSVRAQYEKDRSLWERIVSDLKDLASGMPSCMSCSGRGYIAVTRPRFTTDRFSRERLSMTVRCKRCGLEALARREYGGQWSFKVQS